MTFSQSLHQFSVSQVTNSTTYLSRKVCTNLQIKKIFAS